MDEPEDKPPIFECLIKTGERGLATREPEHPS
jgi:hypothetical protein